MVMTGTDGFVIDCMCDTKAPFRKARNDMVFPNLVVVDAVLGGAS